MQHLCLEKNHANTCVYKFYTNLCLEKNHVALKTLEFQ
jgi:hypothetical protein